MEIDALQARYVKALDVRDMGAWRACFAGPASYICTSRENYERGLPVAIMMDDDAARLDDRVRFVDEVWAGTFEKYATRHVVQRISATARDGASYEVESNFIVAYTTTEGHSAILATGVYLDVVVLEGANMAFRSKTAILDEEATPRYLVYPV